MRILLTGGAGFLGGYVAQSLLQADVLVDSKGARKKLRKLVVLDMHRPSAEWVSDGRVDVVCGDVADEAMIASILRGGIDAIFHFAAILKADTEKNPQAAVTFNVIGLVNMLEQCRKYSECPKFFFASSTGVYENGIEVIQPGQRHLPSSAYGVHKAIGELLVRDYSKAGIVDGRGLRYPLVLVRKNRNDATVSNLISGIIREPMLTQQYQCPFPPDLRLLLTSVYNAAAATVEVHNLDSADLNGEIFLDMPSISVTVEEVLSAVGKLRTVRPIAEMSYAPNPDLVNIFKGRPEWMSAARALQFGLSHDRNIDEVVQRFSAEFLS